MEIQEELRLVHRAKSGEREALALLWDDITPKLYGYLVNQMRHKDLAEDICQETWLKAVQALGNFKDRGVRFSAWVFAIARNECRQHWRGDKKEMPLEPAVDGIDKTNQQSGSDDYLMIETVFAELSAEEQEIIRLRYLAELSFKEIAGVLDVSMVAARVRIHRALAHARVILNQ